MLSYIYGRIADYVQHSMLSRRQVARKLGISPSQVARLDGATLHPIRNAKGFAYYDENAVERLVRSWQPSTRKSSYRPTQLERLADSAMRRDIAILIERGMGLTAILRTLDYDAEETERIYDELSATPEERHQRTLDNVRENGRARELVAETKARLASEYERIGREGKR